VLTQRLRKTIDGQVPGIPAKAVYGALMIPFRITQWREVRTLHDGSRA
jgi:hypothetical protein